MCASAERARVHQAWLRMLLRGHPHLPRYRSVTAPRFASDDRPPFSTEKAELRSARSRALFPPARRKSPTAVTALSRERGAREIGAPQLILVGRRCGPSEGLTSERVGWRNTTRWSESHRDCR